MDFLKPLSELLFCLNSRTVKVSEHFFLLLNVWGQAETGLVEGL